MGRMNITAGLGQVKQVAGEAVVATAASRCALRSLALPGRSSRQLLVQSSALSRGRTPARRLQVAAGQPPQVFQVGRTARLGRALTLTNGTVPVTVRLTRIVDPATGDNNFLKSGDRYLATEFRVSDPATQ